MELYDFEQQVLLGEFGLWLHKDGFNLPGWGSMAVVLLLLIYCLMCCGRFDFVFVLLCIILCPF